MVMSSPLAGAEMITFFAPASRCFAAWSRSVKRPVDSSTMSTPRSFHGSLAGILLGEHAHPVAVDDERVARGLHRALEAAVHRVVLEQVRQRLRVGEVVHRDEVDVR